MEAKSDHLVGYQIEVMNYAAVNWLIIKKRGVFIKRGLFSLCHAPKLKVLKILFAGKADSKHFRLGCLVNAF